MPRPPATACSTPEPSRSDHVLRDQTREWMEAVMRAKTRMRIRRERPLRRTCGRKSRERAGERRAADDTQRRRTHWRA